MLPEATETEEDLLDQAPFLEMNSRLFKVWQRINHDFFCLSIYIFSKVRYVITLMLQISSPL